MSAALQTTKPFVPPYPPRSEEPHSSLSMILTLRRNPLEIWGKADFERPIAIGRSILGLRAAAHDPAAVRRVLLDNAANYRKDALQLRILSPGLGNGILTAEGESWRLQRRSLAPLFAPRQIAEFAPAIQGVAAATFERLGRRRDGAVTDVGDLMSRMTLEVLEQTLFSQGLGREPSEFQRAVTAYLNGFGRLDPLDLLGAPAFLPRFGRLRGRAALEFFNEAVDAIVDSRKALLTRGGEAPRDLLTLLLGIKDPETGLGMPDDDIRANIVTFILAGHETTANGLTWALYLLSQSPQWRERAEDEADSAYDPGASILFRELRGAAGRVRGGAAPLSAGGDALARGHRGRRDPGGAHSRRNGGHDLALCAASSARPLGPSRRLRSGPIPRRAARAHRPIRLYPLRRGTARLHRHGLRDPGGDHYSGQSPAGLPIRPGRGASRHAAAAHNAEAALGHEDAREKARPGKISTAENFFAKVR